MRIPRSARYDNVRAKTATGASMSKHLARLNEIQNNYRIQKGEETGLIINYDSSDMSNINVRQNCETAEENVEKIGIRRGPSSTGCR